jgi:hypothetical protein
MITRLSGVAGMDRKTLRSCTQAQVEEASF